MGLVLDSVVIWSLFCDRGCGCNTTSERWHNFSNLAMESRSEPVSFTTVGHARGHEEISSPEVSFDTKGTATPLSTLFTSLGGGDCWNRADALSCARTMATRCFRTRCNVYGRIRQCRRTRICLGIFFCNDSVTQNIPFLCTETR